MTDSTRHPLTVTGPSAEGAWKIRGVGSKLIGLAYTARDAETFARAPEMETLLRDLAAALARAEEEDWDDGETADEFTAIAKRAAGILASIDQEKP